MREKDRKLRRRRKRRGERLRERRGEELAKRRTARAESSKRPVKGEAPAPAEEDTSPCGRAAEILAGPLPEPHGEDDARRAAYGCFTGGEPELVIANFTSLACIIALWPSAAPG